MRVMAVTAAVVGGAMTIAGCSGANLSSVNDELRAQVLDLEDEVESLRRRNHELEIELRDRGRLDDSVPEAVRAATPHVTGIAIGRLSHARDEDDDGRPDLLMVYVSPRDGLGRFVQLVGDLSVSASLVPAEGEATTVGRRALDPADVRSAYRSGVTGTHYTVELPVDIVDTTEDRCVVRVVYRDGRTGERFSAERIILFR